MHGKRSKFACVRLASKIRVLSSRVRGVNPPSCLRFCDTKDPRQMVFLQAHGASLWSDGVCASSSQ